MDEHREELATIESLDAGAVYTLALKTHVGMSIDTFRYYAGWCDKIQVTLLTFPQISAEFFLRRICVDLRFDFLVSFSNRIVHGLGLFYKQ